MKLNFESTTDFNTIWSFLIQMDIGISSQLWQKAILFHEEKKKTFQNFFSILNFVVLFMLLGIFGLFFKSSLDFIF